MSYFHNSKEELRQSILNFWRQSQHINYMTIKEIKD
jgi:hypothetical protein